MCLLTTRYRLIDGRRCLTQAEHSRGGPMITSQEAEMIQFVVRVLIEKDGLKQELEKLLSDQYKNVGPQHKKELPYGVKSAAEKLGLEIN